MSDLKLAAEFEQQTEADWLNQVEKVLRGADFEKKLVAYTYDGIRIDPLYSATSDNQSTAPGTYPYTRGWSAKSDGSWHINQLHISSDAQATNSAILEDLEGGASSLTIQLAAPGQTGLPATAEALKTALTGVRLDMISLIIDAGSNFAPLSDIVSHLTSDRIDETGAPAISIAADPLGTLAQIGALDVDMDRSLNGINDLARAKQSGLKLDKILTASGHPYHNAGASDAQELSAVTATLVAYMRALEGAGVEPSQSIPMMSVNLAADTELFNTTAKFRAVRKLIAQMADACGCPEAATHVEVRAQTSARMMTRRDPWVNMLRTSAACTGAALGGAQTITALPFTWSLGQPDEFARRMTRNSQIVLMEESALGRVIDPAGGSSYINYLTDQMTEKAWALFQQIEADGGMYKSLQSGTVQAMVKETHEARAKNIALGKSEITGVSSFPNLLETPVNVTPHDLAQPFDDEAITVEPLPMRREAEPFEKLRDAADAYKETNGDLPKLFLANLGVLTDFNARANWASSFFSTGGIEATASSEFAGHDALIDAFKTSGTKIACICSSDAIYEADAEAIAQKLKSAGAEYIYLAGRAGEKRDAYKAAGIDAFVHMGVNSLEILSDALNRSGVT